MTARQMRRHVGSAAAVILASVAATTVQTWSPQGHRLVALVATNHLTPAARQNVTWLLAEGTLADVAVWADQYLEGNNDTAKIGLGLWNRPALAFGLEAALLFGGMSLFLRGRAGPKTGMMVFGIVMLAIQAIVFFGQPPSSDTAAAITALLAYGLFATFVARWEVRHTAISRGAI